MKIKEWAKLGFGIAIAKIVYSWIWVGHGVILEKLCKKFDAETKAENPEEDEDGRK